MAITDERFTTTDLLTVSRYMLIALDHERLKMWHRKGVVPGDPVGHGNERTYSFAELVYVLCLAIVTYRVPYLGEAGGFARFIASEILKVYSESGGDANACESAPAYLIVSPSGDYKIRDFDAQVLTYTSWGPFPIFIGSLALDIGAYASGVIGERNATTEAEQTES